MQQNDINTSFLTIMIISDIIPLICGKNGHKLKTLIPCPALSGAIVMYFMFVDFGLFDQTALGTFVF
jgi:hypothetical protein